MCTVQIVSGPRPRNPKAKRTKTKVKSMKSQNTNQAGPLAGPAPEAGKSCLLTPPLAFARVAQCLVRPKTNSPSPAQRSVHAGARKANSYYFISSRLGLECLLQPGWPDTGYGRRRWRDPTVERGLIAGGPGVIGTCRSSRVSGVFRGWKSSGQRRQHGSRSLVACAFRSGNI